MTTCITTTNLSMVQPAISNALTHDAARQIISEVLSKQPSPISADSAILVFVIVCEILFLCVSAKWIWMKVKA